MSGGHPTLINVTAALAFAGFVVLGLLARRRDEQAALDDDARRRRVSRFLAYALVVSFTAGLTQRDLWPFAAWPIKSLTPLPVASAYRLLGVDAEGGEHAVDYRAWQPLGVDELIPWVMLRFPDLADDVQDAAAAHLLAVAERARTAARAGGRVGTFHRFLGPLSAPYYLLHPRLWRRPEDVPAQPFVALRVYREVWSQMERREHPERVTRMLVYQYPRR
jgi:hypothetical protein